MIMEMRFPDGVAVEALYHGHTIRTDQPIQVGGRGSAPAPFDLFLASIGTCAAYYVLRFCQERKIDTDGLRVSLEPVREGGSPRIVTIRIVIRLPSGFPDRYRKAVLRAVDQCAVKRHIVEPPEFEVVAATADG